MSAANARRKKQLVARRKAGGDAIAAKLQTLLDGSDDEPTAYEALQLAQSQVRKTTHAGSYEEATTLAYSASLTLIKKKRVAVASQLLHLLVEVLRETHTGVSDEWINRLVELHEAYQESLESDVPEGAEKDRLLRLQREFLRKCVSWSDAMGTIRFGNQTLLELLGDQSWKVPSKSDDSVDEDVEDRITIMSDAVQSMCLAEKPEKILEWLKTLPGPKKKEMTHRHTCPPAERDSLFTRAILLFLAVENIRDASTLLRSYMTDVEERDRKELTKSYMKKDDNKAPSHLVFCSMMVSVCQKDQRTGPLFQWLMRSFKHELDLMPKAQIVQSYTTKIGKVYFNIQPPPSMLSMMENMMGMMGGGGGMNPAMMQAAMAGAQGM